MEKLLTEEDVRYVQFEVSRKFNAGYKESQVDDFLNKVEYTLSTLSKQLKAAKTVIDSMQNKNVLNNSSKSAIVKESANESVDHSISSRPKEAPVVQERHVPVTVDGSERATQILSMAQQTAERFIYEAKNKANSIIIETKNKVDYMQVNARNKIAAMQREASEKQIAIINKHNVEKLQLERKIKTLKKFESYYRGYLKTFLNDQKRRLDSELMDGNEPLQLTDTSSSDVNRDDFLNLNSNTNKNKRFTSQNDVGDSNLANSYSSGNIVGGHHEDKREETEENVEMFYQKEDLGSLPKLKRVPIFSDNNNPQ